MSSPVECPKRGAWVALTLSDGSTMTCRFVWAGGSRLDGKRRWCVDHGAYGVHRDDSYIGGAMSVAPASRPQLLLSFRTPRGDRVCVGRYTTREDAERAIGPMQRSRRKSASRCAMSSPRWQVEIVHPVDGKPKVWDSYADRERAEQIARMLRKHGIFAQVRRVDGEVEAPNTTAIGGDFCAGPSSAVRPAGKAHRARRRRNRARGGIVTDRTEASPLPPHSLEAEQSVLGAILLDNAVLDRINGSLASEDFYDDGHRLIFAQAQALHGDGKAVDVTTLHAALDAAGQAEYVGGLAYLGALVENVPTAANAAHYAGIVRERAESRRVAALALEIHDAAMFSRGLSPGELNERMAVLLRNAEALNRPRWSLPGPITSAEFAGARLTPDCIVENYLYADVGVIVRQEAPGRRRCCCTRRSTSRSACRCTGSRSASRDRR